MKKIIVPVDFSDVSKYVTELAVKMAQYIDAEIHFLNVISLPSHILLTPEGELFEDGDFDISIPKQLKVEVQNKILDWANVFYPKAITCVCYGHVNEQVLNYSSKNNADLIVMGTHASSGVKEMIASSHAEYIAMHAAIPLLTLKCDRSDIVIKSMVLASSFKIDEVPHCDLALAMQKAFDAKLYLLRVNTSKDFIPDGEVEKNMKQFAAKHQLTNYECAVYNDHDVEEGIMHFVAKKDVDIIAIGSKQRKGVSKLINGCLSADVLNHIHKPILTFKLKD